jgi:hypothetical protein
MLRKKLLALLIYFPFWALQIMVVDFVVHEFYLHKSPYGPFSPALWEVYYDDFLTNYLHAKIDPHASIQLPVHEWKNAIDIEGKNIDFTEGYSFSPYYASTDTMRNYWLSPAPITYSETYFSLSIYSYDTHNENLSFSVYNYAGRELPLRLQQKTWLGWKDMGELSTFIDSVQSKADTLHISFWNSGKSELQDFRFAGVSQTWFVDLARLALGHYRVINQDENGKTYSAEFEIAEPWPWQVEWELDLRKFEQPDSINIRFKNLSDETLYHFSNCQDQPLVLFERITYKNGIATDYSELGGYSCGGVYVKPVKPGEFFEYDYYYLTEALLDFQNINDENTRKHQEAILGDSVKLRFSVSVQPLGFSKYGHQSLYSPPLVFNSRELVAKWRPRRQRASK